jgi:hypothetical protein
VGLPSADVLQTAPKVRLVVAERGATFVTQSATMEGEKIFIANYATLNQNIKCKNDSKSII